MATVTGTFTVNPPGGFTVVLLNQTYTYTVGAERDDPIARAVIQEFGANATTSGTITITAS